MSFLDHPKILVRKNSYFAALNSHRGFLSYFPTLFAPYTKYVIKGGPGSGKSTLMKKIAHTAEKKGLDVTRYYCSSDTDSLDAVVIEPLQTVILDGTPPHATEPVCPGAVDSLINLTAFWDHIQLKRSFEDITKLSQKITHAYQQVYALMAAIQKVESAIQVATEQFFDKTRAETIILRTLEKHRVKAEKTPKISTRPASAFGVKGYVHLNSYEKTAQTMIHVKDRVIYSQHFFNLLKSILSQKNISFCESVRPIDEKTEAVYLPQYAILFTRLEAEGGSINLDRMLPDRGKGALTSHKTLLREIDSLCLCVEKKLHEIGKDHDELESYYIGATNYQALDQFSQNFIDFLFLA